MSSKRAIRRRSCKGKVRHTEPGQAYGHARRLNRQQGEEGLHHYRCGFCGGWHVGHGKRQKP